MHNNIQRNFIFGDEWLYYKFFCGHNASDKIVSEIIKPVSEKLISEGLIHEWFFIHYTDPSYHIRYRIRIRNIDFTGSIINILNSYLKEFIEQELIWNVEADTYKREIERYGENTMHISETIFFLDSSITVNFITHFNNEQPFERSSFALRLIKFYLDSFELSVLEKLQFTESLKNAFYKEFGSEKDIKKQLDRVFINNQQLINKTFSAPINKSNPVTKSIFSHKKEIKKNINSILNINKAGNLQTEKFNLLSSYIHMSVNRLFISNHRLHELTLYDFLWRIYKKEYFNSKNT
jgi:thiopeptide-type bacteriocin biosynthesis protein